MHFLKDILTVTATIFLFYPLSGTAQVLSSPLVSSDIVFQEENGLVAVEAEFFFNQTHTDVRRWYRTSKNEIHIVGRDEDAPHCQDAGHHAYLEILPDTRVTHEDKLIRGENFSNEAGKMGILHYSINFKNPGRYYVWVRAFSDGSEDNGLHVGIDGAWPDSGQRMQWCEGKNTWRWESKQRTEAVHCGEPFLIYLDIEKAGIHDILFSMREDGFEFDRFLLTNQKSYIPKGIGPKVKISYGELPTSFQVVGGEFEETRAEGPNISGELKKWHKVTLTFDGPEVSENDELSPFMTYRFNVLFSHQTSGKTYKVPGYFAADGNAGETSATRGNKWRVHFAPDETGIWEYQADFRQGKWLAVSERPNGGRSGEFMDGASGSFEISPTDKTGADLRAKGRLQYDGTRYLKFAETGEYFLKVGADAPENLLSYVDFDGTFHQDGHKDNLVKTWEPHLKHWKPGDPTWQGGKGKALIGAVNYLASKDMNVYSFLTNNIAGDDQNVFPYIDYDSWDRFDCSKLDQWEILFEHSDRLGMFLHFKTLEAENQGLLDNGAIGANTKLYYRELMARFGHHLALNWNIGEEIGDWVANHITPPLNTTQRLAAADYFYHHDPYHHHLVIHNGVPFDDVLGPKSKYTGPSVQTNKPDFSRVHNQALKWINLSEGAGKPWAVAVDEPGDAQHALLPDAEDPAHDDARKNGLWGAFMAGAWGTEWYFGYKHAHSDLTCQDFASRDLFWDQCRYVLDFFKGNHIPFWETENHDELVSEGDYCLANPGELYIVFLKNGKGTINLENQEGRFGIQWFDPRKGGDLQKGKIKTCTGGSTVELSNAPSEPDKDWVVLIQKI